MIVWPFGRLESGPESQRQSQKGGASLFTEESWSREFIRLCLYEFPRPEHPVNQTCAGCGHTRLFHGYYMPGECVNKCDMRGCGCLQFELGLSAHPTLSDRNLFTMRLTRECQPVGRP